MRSDGVETTENFTGGFASSSACNMGFPDSGNSQCHQESLGSLPAFSLETQAISGGCTDGTQPSDSTRESRPLRSMRMTASFGEAGLEGLPASSLGLPPERRSNSQSDGWNDFMGCFRVLFVF